MLTSETVADIEDMGVALREDAASLFGEMERLRSVHPELDGSWIFYDLVSQLVEALPEDLAAEFDPHKIPKLPRNWIRAVFAADRVQLVDHDRVYPWPGRELEEAFDALTAHTKPSRMRTLAHRIAHRRALDLCLQICGFFFPRLELLRPNPRRRRHLHVV